MTSDNASNNDTAMKEVACDIDPKSSWWIPDAHRIRCQEHILNLAAQHFVDGVAPTPQVAFMRKIHQALNNGNDANLDTLTNELASMEANDNNNSKDDLFDIGDSLGKALTLIEQVCTVLLSHAFADQDPQIRKSPQAHAFFQKACKEENVPELELLQWIRTHWASLYRCLNHMLLLCHVSIFFSFDIQSLIFIIN